MLMRPAAKATRLVMSPGGGVVAFLDAGGDGVAHGAPVGGRQLGG
ncbi:hypothetical protein [Mycobacterium intracellulare]|nr:hypothetical protein [Mycobacterium intracellulare]